MYRSVEKRSDRYHHSTLEDMQGTRCKGRILIQAEPQRVSTGYHLTLTQAYASALGSLCTAEGSEPGTRHGSSGFGYIFYGLEAEMEQSGVLSYQSIKAMELNLVNNLLKASHRQGKKCNSNRSMHRESQGAVNNLLPPKRPLWSHPLQPPHQSACSRPVHTPRRSPGV